MVHGSPRTCIEAFLSQLRERCQSLCDPGLHLAIDECLMLWKGRLGFKQFIRIKEAVLYFVFVLCPSGPAFSGYSYNFDVYYGKDSNYNSNLTPEEHGGDETPPGSPRSAPVVVCTEPVSSDDVSDPDDPASQPAPRRGRGQV